jgi:hypothetical protein
LDGVFDTFKGSLYLYKEPSLDMQTIIEEDKEESIDYIQKKHRSLSELHQDFIFG